MLISLVVAASINNAIGRNNQLPWHLPNDMKFFKNTTWAMPVIMGRKTFESMAGKPLPGRMNIIITRQENWTADAVTVVHSLQEALNTAQEADYREAFIIGGGEIFAEAMPMAGRIYLTRVATVLDGDVFFPDLDTTEWRLVSDQPFAADAKHAYAYHFQLWEKNKPAA